MRIVITGGAGFIGSHLSERLLKDGHLVLCLDNLITGSKDNLTHLKGKKGFSLLHHNVSQPLKISGAVDYVLHFASPASPPDYLRYPIQTLKVGSLGTLNSLGIAKAKNAKYLLASTSEVYGDPKVHPQPENYWGNVNPVGPRGVYDEAKRFAEAMAMAYHREHGVNTRIIRIFNTYGPRMRTNDGRAIPNFLSQILTNKPITVYGNGKQTRSFCYVTDLVEGIVRLMKKDYHEPVNLGNPDEFTLLELIAIIQKLIPESRSKIQFKALPTDDPKQRRPIITTAKKLLGWAPTIKLVDGLKLTIPWFAQQLRANK